MGHNSTLEVYSFSQANSSRQYVTGSGSVALPTTQSGLTPKFLLVQATIAGGVSETIKAVIGNYITIAPNAAIASGNFNFDMPLVIGNPAIVLLVHGIIRISFAFPDEQIGDDGSTAPDGIDLYMTALENY